MLHKESTRHFKRVLLGNAAIGRGLIEAGCHVVTAYPGTPSSEILPSVLMFKNELELDTYLEWSTNEKVAFDNAYAASLCGKRAAVCMKQVGLNVASDSLMSSAYMGVIGGFVIISCDDPGPHSSQTEQDSRYYAMFSKIPVFDPSTPQEAKEMVIAAFEISEEYQIPVMVRAGIRVCHAKQGVGLAEILDLKRPACFVKAPERWAATPKHRFVLHQKLNAKLKNITERFNRDHKWNYTSNQGSNRLGIVASGVSYVILMDILEELNLNHHVRVLKIGNPYPLPVNKVDDFLQDLERVLILEETDIVIESQIHNKQKILGRLSGHVPLEGELTPEIIEGIVKRVLKKREIVDFQTCIEDQATDLLTGFATPLHKPSLCPGCPERPAFYAIKKAFPKGIYTSDIGCYTLGINLKAVDTVLDMGAGITMASGFYQAYHQDGRVIPIIATMGDSTFYHSGTASLVSAIYNKAKFILVILDNGTTAMTGRQPTPGSGIRADGTEGNRVPLLDLIRGCGVDWVKIVDPYNITVMLEILKSAWALCLEGKVGIPVIIARHPCLLTDHESICRNQVPVKVTDDCNGCGLCIDNFECPALVLRQDKSRIDIDRSLCVNCGVCIEVCPRRAIVNK